MQKCAQLLIQLYSIFLFLASKSTNQKNSLSRAKSNKKTNQKRNSNVDSNHADTAEKSDDVQEQLGKFRFHTKVYIIVYAKVYTIAHGFVFNLFILSFKVKSEEKLFQSKI